MVQKCRKSEQKKKEMEDVFHELNRYYIKMKKKEKKENTRILFLVLQELLRVMRSCDELFDSLRPKLDFLGSFFDGIRVGQPTEYDINVILTFPVNYGKIKLDASDCHNDYTAIVMPAEFRRLAKTPATACKGFTKTQFWCDNNYRLSVTKFRAWMQSTVDLAISTLPLINNERILIVKNKYYKISSKISGPANTIKITKSDNSIIDIDLVPTFEFKLPTKPLNSKIDFSKVAATNILHYFLVPKPGNDDFSWRVSFPFQERYLLKDKNNLKGTIRLIKHFRDVQGFTKISSYFIKTLFLWESEVNEKHYWKKNSLSYLVLTMLKRLEEALNQNRIRNFWCPDNNLIEKIRPVTCKSWYNRISFILRKIQCTGNRNPYSIVEYFSPRPINNADKNISECNNSMD